MVCCLRRDGGIPRGADGVVQVGRLGHHGAQLGGGDVVDGG